MIIFKRVDESAQGLTSKVAIRRAWFSRTLAGSRGNERTFAGISRSIGIVYPWMVLPIDKRRQRIDCITGNIEIPTRSNVNSTRAVNTGTVCHHRSPIGIVVLRRGSADIDRPGNLERCDIVHALFSLFLENNA